MAKTVAARISVEWDDEIHTLEISLPQWKKIRLAKEVTIRGPGYHYEGERFRDHWSFEEGVAGKLNVWTDDGGVCFDGTMDDVELEELQYPRIKIGKRFVLDVRRHMRNDYTFMHYLCVSKRGRGVTALELCRYEPLAEFTSTDPAGKVRRMPTMVKGRKVEAFQYGWLVGGELRCYGMDDDFTFTGRDVGAAKVWLMGKGYFLPSPAIKLIREVARQA